MLHMVVLRQCVRLCNLADLQEVAVRIAEEAADLSTPIDRRRQEDGTPRPERLIGGVAVRHTQCQLMTHGIGILRRRGTLLASSFGSSGLVIP
jgi:hypothetical protein